MKRITATLLMCYTTTVFSQGTFFKSLEGLVKDGKTFQVCLLDQEEGKSATLQSVQKVTFNLKKDLFGNYAGFEVIDSESKKVVPNEGYYECKEKLDHYTHPGYITKVNKDKYIIADSVIYALWYTNDDLTKYKVKSVYIPMLDKKDVPKPNPDLEAVKGLKKRMLNAASKMTLKMGGNAFVLAQSNVVHKKRIDAYLKSIKKVQDNNPYSADTKQKLKKLHEECEKKAAEVQKFNQEYMQSDEYKEIMKRNAFFDGKQTEDAKAEVTLKNLTGEIVMFGDAVNTSGGLVNPGATSTQNCNKDVYLYKSINNTYKRVKLVSKSGSNCNSTVQVQ